MFEIAKMKTRPNNIKSIINRERRWIWVYILPFRHHRASKRIKLVERTRVRLSTYSNDKVK